MAIADPLLAEHHVVDGHVGGQECLTLVLLVPQELQQFLVYAAPVNCKVGLTVLHFGKSCQAKEKGGSVSKTKNTAPATEYTIALRDINSSVSVLTIIKDAINTTNGSSVIV